MLVPSYRSPRHCATSVYSVAMGRQSNSSMHRYECVALCKDISLQRGRFCARSLASHAPRSSEDRSSKLIMNVLRPSCVRPPRWSPPVLWRSFEDRLASICVLVHFVQDAQRKWDDGTSSQILFAQNTSHLNEASGKSSWWAGSTRLKRALTVTLNRQVKQILSKLTNNGIAFKHKLLKTT